MILAALLLQAVQAQAAVEGAPPIIEPRVQRFVVDPKASQVGFEGESPLHDFKGKTSDVSGELRVDLSDVTACAGGRVAALTATLDTDNKRRDKRMRGLLEGKKHPALGYGFETAEGLLVDRTGAVTVHGTWSIRGESVDHHVAMAVLPHGKEGEGLRVRARFEMEMSDFGIEPPRVFLMKTTNEIDVFFDIAFLPVETRWIEADAYELRVTERGEGATSGPVRTERIYFTQGGDLHERTGRWTVRAGTKSVDLELATATAHPPAPTIRDAPVDVVTADGVTTVSVGTTTWIELEGRRAAGRAGALLAALPGLPSGVRLFLHGLDHVPERMTLRQETAEGAHTLAIELGERRDGRVPHWAFDWRSWCSDRTGEEQ